jgi:hypothetical protein
VEVPLELTGLAPGAYSSWTYADPEQWVDESDDGNNIAGPLQVQIAGSGIEGPELEITYFDAISDGSYTY